MVWTQQSSFILSIATNIVILPTNFVASELLIKVTVANPKPNWRFFGDLEQLITLPSPLGQVRLSSQRLRLGGTLLKFDNRYPYELKFSCYDHLPEVAIEIWADI